MALVRVNQEASSSNTTTSDSSRSSATYDVFLSFRGEDTRKTFTDHLYTALDNAGFRIFRDDDEIERGEDISPELQKAIQQSRSSVIVFSKNYASSAWCLEELVMILEHRRTSSYQHVVLPVFYDVDPSNVRKQTGSVADAFAIHKKNRSSNTVERWRSALREVADVAGMALQNQADGHESRFLKKIVKVMEDRLRRTPLGVARYLIGMHSRAENINLWLRDRSTDVGIVIIYGVGGIGKTTIAESVYNANYRRFDRSSFIENVREISKQPNGLVQIQLQLLGDISGGKKVKIHSVREGIVKIRNVISAKKVLLVLDDVDHTDQLDAIFTMQDWFYPGSKIIITTRRTGLLKAHQVTKAHKVETLDFNESMELFSWHAFGQDHPIEGYVELSKRVVHHCGGLPLALKILGSSLSGKTTAEWESSLNKLKAIPNGEVLKILRVSFDSLQDDHDRNLFLHIACFFVGKQKDYIVNVLDGCDFYTLIGIQNLIDRCLITIDRYNYVNMQHALIRDMGRGIVRLESEEPGERSRLWNPKDSFKVLTENTGTQTIEGLALNVHMHPAYTPNEIVLDTNAFARMNKLRLLELSHVQLKGSYEEFPKGLRWLHWSSFSLDFMPLDFPLQNLVVLEMQYSNLRQVWKGKKHLPSLKVLDFSHSQGLLEIDDFSLAPNLERLILEDCASLVDVHESILNLKRLVYLSVKDCKSIRKLTKNIYMLKFLETLIISGCSNLDEFPMEMKKMESLKVLQADDIPILEPLLTITGEAKSWVGRSPEIFWSSLPSHLVVLRLRRCNLSDDDFPKDFGNLSSLRKLDVSGNPICSLPDCIKSVQVLDELNFQECTRLKSLVGLPVVRQFNVMGCKSLEKIIPDSTWTQLPTTQFDGKVKHCCGENSNLVEIGYWFKLVPIGEVDVQMIKLLDLCNLNTTETIAMRTSHMDPSDSVIHPIQYYGFYGIYRDCMNVVYSAHFFPGDKVPGRFNQTSTGPSVSFIVPLPNLVRILGLNICCVYLHSDSNSSDDDDHDDYDDDGFLNPIVIKVSHKSKGLKWIYGPAWFGVPKQGKSVIWLSHWKLGNQLQGGDEVTVSVFMRSGFQLKECGVQLVPMQEEKNIFRQPATDPYDPFGIDGDLSIHEVMPGTYFLCCYPGYEDCDFLRSIWFNKLIRDFDVETDNEEGQQSDGTLAAAVVEAGRRNNNCGRGRKLLIMGAAFFFSLSLGTISSMSQRRKRQSTSPA